MEIEASKTRNVFSIILSAILLACVFDYLFFDTEMIGLSAIVFVGLFTAVLYFFARRFKYNYRSSLWLIAPIMFFAVMPSIRANMFLTFLNIVAVLGLFLLVTKELLLEQIKKFGVKEYFFTIFRLPLKFATNSIRPLRYAINAFAQSSTGKWRRVVLGVVMALPVLVIFTILFSSADLAFRQFVNSIFKFTIPEVLFGHTILILFVFVGMLGIFEYIFKASTSSKVVAPSETVETQTTGREVETGVFLSLIGVLFLIFIIFQVTYLFGGEVNIISHGFTYAEYARHGFWELLVVASATLGILFLVDKHTRRAVSRKIWFTVPTIIIIAEILVIITSAFKRLMLYQDTYGMTDLRFYVIAFIIFLATIFVLLAIKFILEKKESFFTFGVLITMIVFLISINFINPDKFIANANIARFDQTGKIDTTYLVGLSPDAIPQIISVYDRLSAEDKIIAKDKILSNQIIWEKSQARWQSYNFSTSKAIDKLDSFILEKFGAN